MAVLLLGNVLFRFIELPEHVWRLQPLGSALEVRVTETWLLVSLMVGLVCTGTNLIIHDHPHVLDHPERPLYLSWILPGVTAGLSAHLLALVPTWQLWIAGLVLVAIVVSLAIAAEYRAVSPDSPGYPLARLALNVLAYLLTFALFVIVFRTRTRSLITATAIALTGALFSLDMLSGTDVRFWRVVLLACIVGLVVGECTWVLNYWRISSWVGGLLLLLVFYIITNLAHQHLLNRLSLSTLVEFGVVAAVVLTVFLISAT